MLIMMSTDSARKDAGVSTGQGWLALFDADDSGGTR